MSHSKETLKVIRAAEAIHHGESDAPLTHINVLLSTLTTKQLLDIVDDVEGVEVLTEDARDIIMRRAELDHELRSVDEKIADEVRAIFQIWYNNSRNDSLLVVDSKSCQAFYKQPFLSMAFAGIELRLDQLQHTYSKARLEVTLLNKTEMTVHW